MVCRFRADVPLLRLPFSLIRSPFPLLFLSRTLVPPFGIHTASRASLLSYRPSLLLARPWSTLRPVIKQPRGRQIESVEETRERGRRGDGQPAATMVSIVKGLSCCVRVPSKPRQSNEQGNAGIAEGGLRTRSHPLSTARTFTSSN